jgi:hypothetical protein
MVDINGVSRPQSQRPEVNSGRSKKPRRFKTALIVAGAILVLLLASAGTWFVVNKTGVTGSIDGSRYQAVFFTNGQVYFGKLKAMNGDYMRLTDIYYLQAKSTEGNESNPQEASAQDASNVQLVKLGSEIHGPDDEMVINKDQILFFENLKKDSNVSSTISNYQSQKK